MYHKPTISSRGYYDTLEEMPIMVKVKFPEEKEFREMTADEVCALDDEGWYTVMHSVNWGCCDHWTSEKPSKWIKERFNHIIHYTKNGKNDGEHVGYDRAGWNIVLTKDANVWHSEVWNS